MISTVERVRAWRRRRRRGLELLHVELDLNVVLDGLVSAGLLDEPPEGECDRDRIGQALSQFTDMALRQIRKIKYIPVRLKQGELMCS